MGNKTDFCRRIRSTPGNAYPAWPSEQHIITEQKSIWWDTAENCYHACSHSVIMCNDYYSGGYFFTQLWKQVVNKKKEICGRKYDTETATMYGGYSYGCRGDFYYEYGVLYRKKNGDFFTEKEEPLQSIVGTVVWTVTREERISILWQKKRRGDGLQGTWSMTNMQSLRRAWEIKDLV